LKGVGYSISGGSFTYGGWFVVEVGRQVDSECRMVVIES
jgi:hypothetical protein